MIDVAVLGMGVIGKRVVHAVRAQPDMRITGVVLRSPSPAALAAPELPIFAHDHSALPGLREAGMACVGELADALARCDVLVDCGPAGSAATRHAEYRAAGVRVVYCGGERSPELGPLVHPGLNPAALRTGRTHRAASCNTTAVARVLAAVNPAEVAELELVVVRCCTDNDKAGRGITNGAVLSGSHTHHAVDLCELYPGLVARSAAATVPMTCGHIIHVRLRTTSRLSRAELVARLCRTPRIQLPERPGAVDTAALKDARWQRRWHNRYELLVQPLSVGRDNVHELWLALDNEAVTIPELMDIVRCSVAGEPADGGARTDAALGMVPGSRSRHDGVVHAGYGGDSAGEPGRPESQDC